MFARTFTRAPRHRRASGPHALAVVIALAALPASLSLADEPKKDPKKDAKADPFGDLFGETKEGPGMTDLKAATGEIDANAKSKGLTPREAIVDENAGVELVRVFAAERIVIHRERGCEPGDREKTKLKFIEFSEVPTKGPSYSVCVTLKSRAGREMRIATSIVDPKNHRVARSESVVSFRGKTTIDHVMEFPVVEYKLAGPYQYVVDIDGKEAGRMPLLEIRVDPT
jgi:hypothetical protein